MTYKALMVGLIASLPLLACGSSSSDTADTGVAVDTAKTGDTATADKPMNNTDTNPAQTPDGAVDKSLADADANLADVQMSKLDGASDLGQDTADRDASVDATDASDATLGAGSDGLLQAKQDFACHTDSDCCTLVDTCAAVAYLYSKASAGPLPTPRPYTGTCLPCAAPAIQLRCVDGMCTGEKLSQYEQHDYRLTEAHCGSLTVATDAGLGRVVQTNTAPTQTSWSCGS